MLPIGNQACKAQVSNPEVTEFWPKSWENVLTSLVCCLLAFLLTSCLHIMGVILCFSTIPKTSLG